MEQPQDEGLLRIIGTKAVALAMVNMVIGAGVFALPGIVAAEFGAAAIVACLICSVTVALICRSRSMRRPHLWL